MARNQGLDALRTFLTLLVVVHHVSIVYGGAGGWYWKETSELDHTLVAFNAVNQSFFMGLFFLLAGYFSIISLRQHGISAFVRGRAVRLGVPLFVYFLLISPLTVALATANSPYELWSTAVTLMARKQFEPGPLWFVFVLILLSSLLAFIYARFPHTIQSPIDLPSPVTIGLCLILVGCFTFLVRLSIPVGETVLWLQLGYFPLYLVLFYFGVVSGTNKLISTAHYQRLIIWAIVALFLVVTLPFVIQSPLGDGPFEGGFNLNALYYALWEPFVACGIIVGLFWFFQRCNSRLIGWLATTAPLAYCVYIIHPPIIVVISKLLPETELDRYVKLLVNSVVSATTCLLAAKAIVSIPGFRRVL